MGNKTSYTYDTSGRVLTATDALNRVTTYTYDTAGNLTKLVGPQGAQYAMIYTYDRLNRQVSMTTAPNTPRAGGHDQLLQRRRVVDQDSRPAGPGDDLHV